ncbi:MAG: helix-turn-helix domain-containing protein [Duncaniella sp.]|nr:helix-turn-helix domain-containing protein [Duncaniella sp.]
MDLVSRLKQYLNTRGISITQFADECDIPRPSASQLLAGRNKKVSDEIIGKIHYTYPELSVSWLMFGEGEMVIGGNIATSKPQNEPSDTESNAQKADIQDYSSQDENLFSVTDSDSEKSEEPETEEFSFVGNTFAFAGNTSTTSTPTAAASSQPQSQQSPNRPITVTPGKGKCVTGIVVYYSDSTYESFVPDPEAKHPFMR